MGKINEIGLLEYNGFRFNETTKTTRVRVTPEKDSAGRTTTHNTWSLTFVTYIYSEAATGSTDLTMKDMICRLSEQGCDLRFQARGLGNPNINTGGMKDVKWGPVPGPIEVVPLGHGNAQKVTWSVDFCIPRCTDCTDELALMEFNYTSEHDIDHAGFTTRRIRGHLVIPATRKVAGGRDIPDSADNYRKNLFPPLPLGWKRTFQPFVLSEDRRRLDFGCSDEEQGGDPLPPGIASAVFSESVNTTRPGLKFWAHTLNASYEIHRTGTGIDALNAFFEAATVRLKEFDSSDLVAGEATSPAAVIPTSFQMSNPNRYGKPAANFSLTFTYVSTLKNLLLNSGMWDPLGTQDTWQKWQTSVKDTVLNPYGASNLVFAVSSEKIVDLCQVINPPIINQMVPKPIKPGDAEMVAKKFLKEAFPKPKPGESWIDYQNAIFMETDDGVIPVTTLPKSVVTSDTDMYGSADSFAGDANDALSKSPKMPSDIGATQTNGVGVLDSSDGGTLRRTEPHCYLYLRGMAIRAAYPIDAPRLVSVNGVVPVPANRLDRGEGFARSVAGSAAFPIHYAKWNLRYYLPSIPKGALPAPTNPMYGASS